ncbi:MAG: ParB/RepB/Spo0J family partition protein [Leptospiraceae bacterium]|nr:ParB/RepB/Spo0J family partition protein [Leptospiraceae bacterium]
MSSKTKLALLDNNQFPIDLIEFSSNIRDVSENESELKDLADSIKQYGQLEPIGISIEENKNGKFELIYGHRRFLAIKKILKKKEIKVVQVFVNGSRKETQLIENIHRKDLTDLEIAKTLKAIKGSSKATNKKISKIVCKSEDWIESKLSHLEVYESLDSKIQEKALTLTTDKLRPLKKLNKAERNEKAKEIVENNLTVKEVRELVNPPKSYKQIEKNDFKKFEKAFNENDKSQIKEKDRMFYTSYLLNMEADLEKEQKRLNEKFKKVKEMKEFIKR